MEKIYWLVQYRLNKYGILQVMQKYNDDTVLAHLVTSLMKLNI